MTEQSTSCDTAFCRSDGVPPETRESDPGLLLCQEPLCPDRRTEDNRGGDLGQGNRQHPAVKGTKACRCRRREGIRPREERRGRDWFRSLKKLRCFNRLVHLAAGAASTARAHFGRDSTCPDEVEREARNFVGQSGRALASHARGPWSDPRCSGRLLTRCLSEPTPAKRHRRRRFVRKFVRVQRSVRTCTKSLRSTPSIPWECLSSINLAPEGAHRKRDAKHRCRGKSCGLRNSIFPPSGPALSRRGKRCTFTYDLLPKEQVLAGVERGDRCQS